MISRPFLLKRLQNYCYDWEGLDILVFFRPFKVDIQKRQFCLQVVDRDLKKQLAQLPPWMIRMQNFVNKWRHWFVLNIKCKDSSHDCFYSQVWMSFQWLFETFPLYIIYISCLVRLLKTFYFKPYFLFVPCHSSWIYFPFVYQKRTMWEVSPQHNIGFKTVLASFSSLS